MQRVDFGWVFTNEPGRNVALQRLRRGGYDVVTKALALAGNALVRLHLDQQMILAWKPQASELSGRCPHVIGNADIVGLDGGNFHLSVLAAFCLAIPR